MIDPMIGRTVLGRYRIVRALAKGGMGVVYLARSEGASGFTKPVVVKRMASDLMVDESMARMFVREARLMSRLRHPGLVQVIDFGEQGGDYLMIIEYVHGYHLGQWARFTKEAHGPFPADLVVHIMIKVLDGLQYAHTLTGEDNQPLGIVHRDVSPSNILLDVDGHVKLADFGVARSRDQTEQTEQSTIKGKMPYLAPELFRLEDPSPSSDAYACAVVLHEILTGKNEFRAQDVATTVSRVLEHTPSRVDRVRTDLPPGLGPLLAKALSKLKEDRFPDAASFASALREIRPAREEDMQARVAVAIHRDFRDPKMSETLRLPSLEDREHAWRSPPIAAENLDVPRRSSAPPTTVEKRPSREIEVTLEKRRPWGLIAGAAVAVAAIAGGVIAYVGTTGASNGSAQQTFVVVESPGPRPEPSEPRTEVVVDTTAPTEEPDESTDESTNDTTEGPDPTGPSSPGPGPRRGGPALRDLTRAFGARSGEVRACFNEHEQHAPAGGSVDVSFHVDRDGRVLSASVTPPAVGGTPLGACIIRIASSTRFPRQSAPVRFRIPVSVRRSP
jgi:serine/threonine-protein kinase